MPLQIHRARTSFQSSKFRSRECTWAEPGSNPTRALYTLSSRAWDPLHPLSRPGRASSASLRTPKGGGEADSGFADTARSSCSGLGPAAAAPQSRRRRRRRRRRQRSGGPLRARSPSTCASAWPSWRVGRRAQPGSRARQRGQPRPPASAKRWAQLPHSQRPQGRAAASPGSSRHPAQPDGCNTSTAGPEAEPGAPVLAAAILAQRHR